MFERVFTVGLPTGQGPAVKGIDLRLPDTGDYSIEAWLGNFGSSNAYVLEGSPTLIQAQDLLPTGAGPGGNPVVEMDVLIALTGTGKSRRRISHDIGRVTVFFEAQNTSGQTQTVSVRVISRDLL